MGLCFFELPVEVGQREHGDGVGLVGEFLQFLDRVRWIQRADDTACFQNGVVADDEIGRIGHAQAHRLTFFYAQVNQGGGQRITRAVEFAVVHDVRFVTNHRQAHAGHECRIARQALRCIAQIIRNCRLRVGFDRSGDARRVVLQPGAIGIAHHIRTP